jgi:hypothetical protein
MSLGKNNNNNLQQQRSTQHLGGAGSIVDPGSDEKYYARIYPFIIHLYEVGFAWGVTHGRSALILMNISSH